MHLPELPQNILGGADIIVFALLTTTLRTDMYVRPLIEYTMFVSVFVKFVTDYRNFIFRSRVMFY